MRLSVSGPGRPTAGEKIGVLLSLQGGTRGASLAMAGDATRRSGEGGTGTRLLPSQTTRARCVPQALAGAEETLEEACCPGEGLPAAEVSVKPSWGVTVPPGEDERHLGRSI